MQYKYDFLFNTEMGQFMSVFADYDADYWQTFCDENNHNPLVDGQLDGMILDFFISYFDMAYLPRELAKEFMTAIFTNLDHFGSFNFLILILKALFGAETANVIKRTYGSVALEVVNPDESRFAFYIDENGRQYVDENNANYVTLLSDNIDNFADWVRSFLINFLCAGTTVTSLIVRSNSRRKTDEHNNISAA